MTRCVDPQHPVFQTKPGEPDKKSGVPPALLTFTVLDIFTQAVKLDLSLGRPLKLNLGTSLYNQLADVASTLKESLCLDDIMKLVDVDSAHSDIKEDSNCDDSLAMSISNLKSFAVGTKQVVVKFPTQQHFNPKSKDLYAELSASVSRVELNCNLSSKQREARGGDSRKVQMVSTHAEVEGALLKTTVGIYSHKLLGPWSFEVNSEVQWPEPDLPRLPNVSVRVRSNLLHLEVGPNHILALEQIKSHVVESFPQWFEATTDQKTTASQPQIVENVTKAATSDASEQHYKDDLRAGAFQYIDASSSCDSSQQPKSYQCCFDERAGTMTWRYPQPRTLTRVSVFPVPLKKASDLGSPGQVKPGPLTQSYSVGFFLKKI